MLREITIGQYYPVESVIHRLDPRVKILGTIGYLISLFVIKGYLGFIFAALFLGVVTKLSGVPVSYMVRGLRAIVVLVAITAVFNLFFVPGETLFTVFGIRATREGLVMAVLMTVRMVLLILGTSLMTFTTTPGNLTDGLERLMRPLEHIKVPVADIAMMMSIALRFIPILQEETVKIMKAQTARGADFDSGGLIKKVKGLVPLLVPLFVSAFRRADDLALAMEARCYSGAVRRTKMEPLVFDRVDYAGLAIMAVYLAAAIALP